MEIMVLQSNMIQSLRYLENKPVPIMVAKNVNVYIGQGQTETSQGYESPFIFIEVVHLFG
jgi:hypothetical protein